MIGEVASLVGGDDDPDVRTRALTFLDRSVDHLNMNGVVMFQRRESTFTGLTNGQSTLTLPSDWGWPDDRAWAYNVDDKQVGVLEWRPWEHFKTFIHVLTDTHFAIPDYLSIKTEINESLIYVWPYIDTNNVAKIIVPYFARVSTLSEVSTFLVSKEIREALIMYGEYLMMRYRYKDRPQIWAPFKADATEAMRRAKASAQRSESGWHVASIPDETGRIGDPARTIPFGVSYIVVGGQ